MDVAVLNLEGAEETRSKPKSPCISNITNNNVLHNSPAKETNCTFEDSPIGWQEAALQFFLGQCSSSLYKDLNELPAKQAHPYCGNICGGTGLGTKLCLNHCLKLWTYPPKRRQQKWKCTGREGKKWITKVRCSSKKGDPR